MKYNEEKGRSVETLLTILRVIRPESNFVESQDFINDGLLDSFDVVMIVSKLEEKMKICIDGEDITPENFKNLEALEQFLRRYINQDDA